MVVVVVVVVVPGLRFVFGFIRVSALDMLLLLKESLLWLFRMLFSSSRDCTEGGTVGGSRRDLSLFLNRPISIVEFNR